MSLLHAKLDAAPGVGRVLAASEVAPPSLPAVLLLSGPYQLFLWQWFALFLLVPAAGVVGWVMSRVSRRILSAAVQRTRFQWDDVALLRLTAPMTLAWALACGAVALPWVELHASALGFVRGVLRIGVLLTVFWALTCLIDVGREALAVSDWTKNRPATRSLLPLATRVFKLFVLAAGIVAMLSELGYPVASLVAGLGIGGVALALGAQKTLENLFGAFSLGADQPFREGDFVRIEDFVGTVESIGLRSTRIRTLDRTIVTIPNGRLADSRLESFAARDRLRLACTLGLVYGTSAAQVRAVLSSLERVLREHPKIWPDAVIVRFKEFGESSLNIEVMAWFRTSDWNEFLAIREEVLLRFMEVVEREKSSFAFPTRTLHIVQEGKGASAGAALARSGGDNARPREIPRF